MYIYSNRRREKLSDYYIIGLLLLIASLLSIVSTVASTGWIEPVSRRMANITFILWIVSYRCIIIIIIHLFLFYMYRYRLLPVTC